MIEEEYYFSLNLFKRENSFLIERRRTVPVQSPAATWR